MASLDDTTVPTNTIASTVHANRSRSEIANQIATPATAITNDGLSALWLNNTQNIRTEARKRSRNRSLPQPEYRTSGASSTHAPASCTGQERHATRSHRCPRCITAELRWTETATPVVIHDRHWSSS